jgi:hypothetical protein
MDDLVCARCGNGNPPDANFCTVCGAPLPQDEAHTESHMVMAEPPDGEVPMLVVVRGANAGSRFALTDDVTTIGRHPDSDVFLDDVTVSRRHAEVHRTASAGLEVCDVGSLNGTYVNGDRIERIALAEGDQLQVGKYRLVVVGGTGVVD